MRNVRRVRLRWMRALLAVSLLVFAGPLGSAPSNVSVTPSSGTGSSQTFSYVFSDPNGFADIVSAQMLVGATLSASNSCYLYFERSTNRVWLADDAGVGNVSLATLGTAVTLQNSQCVFDAQNSSSSGTGTNLTVNVALTFKPAFAGAKTNFMTAFDGTNVSPWQAMGTWTVPNPVNITINTSPAGRAFTVDGSPYSTQQSFSWMPGLPHTIGTSSPQAGPPGTQYVSPSWSDGGALSHQVAPSGPTTYTATFTTQYYLTTAASPTAGGTISPGSGWYNAGAGVSVSATANPGYGFTGFSGSLQGLSPQTLNMTA